jgi:hypothetical protein
MIDSAIDQRVPRQVGAVNQTWAEGQNRGLGGIGGSPRAPFEVTPTAPLGCRVRRLTIDDCLPITYLSS